MGFKRRRFAFAFAAAVGLVVVACVIVLVFGGSSASTSRADAAAVARAEGAFLKGWGKGTIEADHRCEEGTKRTFHRCFSLELPRATRSAVADFTTAIEGVLADGVGNACSEALEEALAEYVQIPYFPDEAAITCRDESRS
jgi:hypothetical protein